MMNSLETYEKLLKEKREFTGQLDHMFELQYSMQKFNSEKRLEVVDPDSSDTKLKLKAAMYYWNCAVVEFYELTEWMGYEKEGKTTDIHEEAVDICHFLLSVMIYSGISKLPNPLPRYFPQGDFPPKEFQLMNSGAKWIGVNACWGGLLDSLPYKIWKTYEEKEFHYVITNKQMDLAEGIFQMFCQMCHAVHLSSDGLYLGYLNKNKENLKRQQKGGMYER